MLLSIRALSVLTVLLAGGSLASAADDRPATPAGGTTPDQRIFQVVKRFDFDERPLGNYEAVPMYWRQLEGDGLPRYSAGEFDRDHGHTAPPSFAFGLKGGSIVYEYERNDMVIAPEADHLLVGYIRAVGLEDAHAFVHAYLVDQFGDPISGSDRVSDLVQSRLPADAGLEQPGTDESTAALDKEPWQRVEISLPGEYPTAYALRLRFWVLQAYAWHPPAPTAVDPIIRQDVSATVWFDDFTLYRLPHVDLRLSRPGGIVYAGEPAAAVLDVHNPTRDSLVMDLRVLDVAGQELHQEQTTVPAHTSAPLESPLPDLSPGLYSAELRFRDVDENLLYRSIRFAVLPPLPRAHPPQPDFGVDIGCWRQGDVAGAAQLVKELRCGAAKVGTPLVGAVGTDAREAYFEQIRALARMLLGNRIHTTGVLLPPGAFTHAPDRATIRHLLERTPDAAQHLAPALARLAGLLTCWQLGDERSEVDAGSLWEPAALRRLRTQLSGFVTAPQMVVPCSAFDDLVGAAAPPGDTRAVAGAEPDPGRPDAVSIHVPTELPTRAFASQLGLSFVSDAPSASLPAGIRATERWVNLAADSRGLSAEWQLIDLARRVVLAKALGAERVYVPAPFAQSSSSGRPAWYPTAAYPVLRALFLHLSGKQVAGVMPLVEQDAVAIVFAGDDSACLVLWTWRADPVAEPLELYLGPRAVLCDAWGRGTPCEMANGRARVPLSAMPTVIDQVDAPLAVLQADFGVEPAFVQPHDPEPVPVLHLRNPYRSNLAGVITISLPEYWRLSPTQFAFELTPGDSLAHDLRIEVPPREMAGQRSLGVRVELRSPVSEVLEFAIPLTVGLHGLELKASAHWEGDNLLVEQLLYNRSTSPVSFESFCRAPRYPQLEGALLNVRPGQARSQVYCYPNARDLAGSVLRLGVREIRGRRSLDQLVEAPH